MDMKTEIKKTSQCTGSAKTTLKKKCKGIDTRRFIGVSTQIIL